ncbi:MAG TPA: hypothetical protein VGB56_06055 [Flavisolibacter sp.]|jgi:hypothetical protein
MKHLLIFLSSLLLILLYSFTALHTLESDLPEMMKVTLGKSPGRLAPCDDHGGPAGVGMEWTIATRNSGCESGIGFRCGRRPKVTCGDGYVWYGDWSGLQKAGRIMQSSLVFYTNNTMKITLDAPLPAGESSRFLDVEELEYHELPDAVYLNRVKYTGYNVLPGKYAVNLKGGPFGSITVSVQLLN